MLFLASDNRPILIWDDASFSLSELSAYVDLNMSDFCNVVHGVELWQTPLSLGDRHLLNLA